MTKKILFIDRDGTLIVEPKDTFQIDSLEKLEFLPKVIQGLVQIQNLHEYLLVMVSNQDGLGTVAFPENDFWLPQNKMLQVFENEGIVFHKIHIDHSFEHENLPTRKPNVGMLKEYFSTEYDLPNSFVIGDRITDVQLAENLGAKAIIYGGKHDSRAVLRSSDWLEIANFLKSFSRKASIHRKTNETDIRISLDLDSRQKGKIHTGIGFFDHLLDQLAKHSGCFMEILVSGDLHIDEHHSIEDTALAIGEAFLVALGEKKGINRYGHFLLPMDETLSQVALDFSGRPQLVWNAEFKREKVGDFPTEMFYHFFKSFSDTAKCNLNIKIEGENEHHKIEATFKAFAKAIKMAIVKEAGNNEIPSTKGVL